MASNRTLLVMLALTMLLALSIEAGLSPSSEQELASVQYRQESVLQPTIVLTGGNFISTGATISGAGDLDGDGIPDLVVGDTHGSGDHYQWGVHIVPGWVLQNTITVDLSETPTLGAPEYYPFGSSLAPVGDLDGDGYDGFVISARSTSWVSPFTMAYLIPGGPDVFEAPLIESAIEIYRSIPESPVTAVGDVNGDGLQDFMMGTWYGLVLGHDRMGSVGIDLNRTVQFDDTTDHGTLGDINGDGLDDLVFRDGGYSNFSRVRIHFGRTAWPANISHDDANITLLFDDNYSAEAISGGDLDGDGFDDLVMANRTGEVWVLWGAADLEDAAAELIIDADFGSKNVVVDASGDLDNDGANDILLGLDWGSYDYTSRDPEVHIYSGQMGSRNLTDTGLSFSMYAYPIHDWVHYIGDVDQDGQEDFAIGTAGNPDSSALIFTDVSWSSESGDDRDEKDDQGREPDWREICIPAGAILVICIMALLFEFRWIPGRRSPDPQLPMNEPDSSIAGPPDLQR